MKASMHSGRQGSAKHNDRSFLAGKTAQEKTEIAPHIDTSKKNLNRLYTIHVKSDSHKILIERDELVAYTKLFSDALEATNRRYKAQGHSERCRTIEDLYKARQTRPEEVILQIGDAEHHPTAEELTACFNDYIKQLAKWNHMHGDHMVLLSAAIHADETTPHVHMRRVWTYTDTDGHKRIGQGKALELARVPLPHPEKPIGRYNNRKMSFDKLARQMWIDVCRSHGYDIDDVPRTGVSHKTKQNYMASQISSLQKELQAYKDMEKAYPEEFHQMRDKMRRHNRQKRFDFDR